MLWSRILRSCCRTTVEHKPNFKLEPWHVREESLDLPTLAETESLFALANGHLGLEAIWTRVNPSACRGPT